MKPSTQSAKWEFLASISLTSHQMKVCVKPYKTFRKFNFQALVNSNDGHLIRTKPAASNVGGVAAGGACIGSIAFVGEEED